MNLKNYFYYQMVKKTKDLYISLKVKYHNMIPSVPTGTLDEIFL